MSKNGNDLTYKSSAVCFEVDDQFFTPDSPPHRISSNSLSFDVNPNDQHVSQRNNKRTMSESLCQDSEGFSSDDETDRNRQVVDFLPKKLDVPSPTLNSLISPRSLRKDFEKETKKRSFSPWRFVTTCLRSNRSFSMERPSVSSAPSTARSSAPCSLPMEIDIVKPMGAMPNFSNEHSNNGEESLSSANKIEQSFFRQSRFSFVPPTVRFCLPSEKVEKPKRSVRKMLKWCHNSLTPKVVRKCLATSHFEIVDERSFWIGYWGRHLKSSAYRYILPYQKVNHYPGTFNLGRKDRLWTHINRMAIKFGAEHFDLMPHTYILPRDAKRFKLALKSGVSKHFILKPPASARGTGIRIIHKWRQVPRKQPVVAQHYIDRPLLINGNKFDLRLYVYITSFYPLRVYLYEDGLVRFASVKYTNALSSMSNRFMHLTNYSINKTAVPEGESSTPCDKWTVRELWQYLSDRGYDVKELMEKIVDLILKSIISCEASVLSHVQQHIRFPFVCHELFGFDVLLDRDLTPWLLEINISPSLHSGTELDVSVKSLLARDVLNLSGIQIADKNTLQSVGTRLSPSSEAPSEPHCLDFRLKTIDCYLTEKERIKQATHIQRFVETGKVDCSILDGLTPSDIRALIETEDECDRRGQFTRLFPSPFSSRYLQYFDRPRYLNLLLDEWTTQYFHIREAGCSYLESLCKEKEHLVRNNPIPTG